MQRKLTKKELATARALLLGAALRGKSHCHVRMDDGLFIHFYRRKGYQTGKWHWASYVDVRRKSKQELETEAFADLFYIETHKDDGEARALALALRAGEREWKRLHAPKLSFKRVNIGKLQDTSGGWRGISPNRLLMLQLKDCYLAPIFTNGLLARLGLWARRNTRNATGPQANLNP